jgi:hypothetical protein
MAAGRDGTNIDLLKGVPVLVVEDVWHVARALKVDAGANGNACGRPNGVHGGS